MAPRFERLLPHLRRLVSEREPEPDAVLLSRFVKERDEAAFAELVRRHGAMVLGVCRRVLHDEHQAEDALQATFLLLAKKAASVRPTASLAAWLHTVARHLALKCRRTEERRRLRETARAQSPAVEPPRDPLDELTARELLHILDEEIQRLSEAYRLPLILCALEGLSVEEAAHRLVWAPGSVRGRLARGRARLHARLARRGVMLPAGAVAALLAPRVEASLSALTVKTMTNGAGVSARAAELAESGLRGITRTKLKIGIALLLSAAFAGAGGLAYQVPPAEQPVTNQQAESAKSQAIPKERTDLYGEPLPRGAVARLGTVRFRLGGLFYACAYSPDGKTLAAGSDDAVHLFDAANGKPIRQLRLGGYITSVAYSPDGKTLAAGRECGLIQIWDLATGKFLRQFGDPTNSIFPLRSLAFTPDGKKLISGGGGNRLVYLWDPATGKELRRFAGHAEYVRCMVLSPDGRTIASASADEIRLWETNTGKMIRRLAGQKEPIRALAFSPDGKWLASGSENGPVCLWEIATGKVCRRFPEDSKKRWRPNRSLAFSPDGKILANGYSDHTLFLWDVATGAKLREIAGTGSETYQGWNDGGIQCVVFSPDGRRLAFGQDNRLALLDVQSGEEVLPLPSHRVL